MVIDSESPWRVTLRDWNWPVYTYKMSASEWRALLAQAKRSDPEAEWEVADRYGLSPAQNTLGVILSNGDGVRKDVDEALLWLRRAFRAGDACAAQNMAITYRQIGDLRTAVKWFRKSADAGDGDALIQLGIHYYWGKGVRKNPNAAVRCFRIATKAKNISEAGRDDAFFFLGVAYSEGEGVRASVRNARKLLERANIDNDHPAASKILCQLQA